MLTQKGRKSRHSSVPDFRIKLLSGSSVVMVEADDFESEIFMPHVLNGRLSFQNVIPNRRCGCATSDKSVETKKTQKRIRTGILTTPNVKNNNPVEVSCGSSLNTQTSPTLQQNSEHNNIGRMWRMTAGQEMVGTGRRVAPLANSTPVVKSENIKENMSANDVCSSHSYTMRTGLFSTPDAARCAPSQTSGVPSPYQVLKNTIVQIPSGIKVIRLYRKHTEGTPKSIGRIVKNSSTVRVPTPTSNKILHDQITHRQNFSNNSGFQIPATPDFGKRLSSCSSNVLRYPQALPLKQMPSSTTKWRKCLTPVRTYSRRTEPDASSNFAIASIKRTAKRVKPTYLVNPTQGTRPSHKLEVRRRRLIVDPKLNISTRTFKKQQQHTDDIENKAKLDAAKLPQNRRQLQQCESSAFDLLTNCNRLRNMSSRLNEQFRKRCVNKASSTYSKYKLLCTLPPLQQDEQTRELSRTERDVNKALSSQAASRRPKNKSIKGTTINCVPPNSSASTSPFNETALLPTSNDFGKVVRRTMSS